MALGTLPRELLVKILALLDPRDLGRVSVTACLRMCTYSNVVWQHIWLREYGPVSDPSASHLSWRKRYRERCYAEVSEAVSAARLREARLLSRLQALRTQRTESEAWLRVLHGDPIHPDPAPFSIRRSDSVKLGVAAMDLPQRPCSS